MYNYICPACGARLDPGEKCDCGGQNGAKKFGSPNANQTDPKSAPTGNIPVDKTSIAQKVSPVKGVDVRKLRLAKNIPAKAMVATVHKRFPGYDTTLQSKVERPDYYGIRLLPEAETALLREFAPEIVRSDRRWDRHRRTSRDGVRLDEDVHDTLLLLFKRYGHRTVQDGLEHLVGYAIKHPEILLKDKGENTHDSAAK